MPCIRVIEDHAIVREPLARLLRLEGYRTLCAANGIEAMRAVDAEPVDLILLDLMMPKMDGVVFLEQLRASARHTSLPVILLTGVIEGSMLVRVKELGVVDVMPKGRFSIDELFVRIAERLRGPVAAKR